MGVSLSTAFSPILSPVIPDPAPYPLDVIIKQIPIDALDVGGYRAAWKMLKSPHCINDYFRLFLHAFEPET